MNNDDDNNNNTATSVRVQQGVFVVSFPTVTNLNRDGILPKLLNANQPEILNIRI